MSKIWAKV